MNLVRLQQFIENYPEIRLIIDPQNPKKGMALVEEYCEKNKMEYTYNLLLTISFSCVDVIVVLLVVSVK